VSQDAEITQLDNAEDPSERAEPELFCPNCDYNLKGLPDEICPECGKPFDREELLIWATGYNVSMSNWLPAHITHDLIEMIRLCLLSPTDLARALPPNPNYKELSRVGFTIRTASIVPAALLVFLRACVGSTSLFEVGLVLLASICAWLGVLAGSVSCERLIAFSLSRLTIPLAVSQENAKQFWRALCHCFSTYLLVSSTSICLTAIVLFNWRIPTNVIAPLVAVIPPICSICWWWYSLGQAIRRRCLPSPGRLGMPIVLILATGVGLVTGYLTALISFMCCTLVCSSV
jgi:hypothetical protein